MAAVGPFKEKDRTKVSAVLSPSAPPSSEEKEGG